MPCAFHIFDGPFNVGQCPGLEILNPLIESTFSCISSFSIGWMRAPSNVEYEIIDLSTLEISWTNSPENGTFVVLEIHSDDPHPEQTSYGQSMNITGLIPKTQYRISLYTKTDYNRSSVKITLNITFDPDPPLIGQCKKGNLTFLQQIVKSSGPCGVLREKGRDGTCRQVADKKGLLEIVEYIDNITSKKSRVIQFFFC